MYGIYANIWGILMVNVTIYSSTMDPMGYSYITYITHKFHQHFSVVEPTPLKNDGVKVRLEKIIPTTLGEIIQPCSKPPTSYIRYPLFKT